VEEIGMLSKQDMEAVDDRVELGVRRYFDHYLENVWPVQMQAHNDDCTAHGGVAKKLLKLKWYIIGAVMAGGGGGAALAKLLGS